MLFISRYEVTPSVRKAAIERFMKTGGTPPPGVKMLGRWHSADGAFGIVIAESDDIQAIGQMEPGLERPAFDVRPAIDDQGLAEVLAAMQS